MKEIKFQEEHEELRQQMGGLNINQHEMDREYIQRL